ncbi:MAG: glycosyltransferase family 4 protein [Desulfurococcaceae archaeon]
MIKEINKKRKLKVCMIVPGEFPAYGGLENFVYSLSESLVRKGFDVCIIAPRPGFSRGAPRGVKVYALPKKSNTTVSLSLLNSFAEFLECFAWMIRVCILARRERVDILHAHQCFPSGLYCLLAKLVLRKPLICTSHGEDIQMDLQARYGMRRSKTLSAILKVLLKLVDAHVIVSKSMLKDALSAGSRYDRIHVIYNGIDTNLGCSEHESEAKEVLKKLRIEPSDFVILFLGRVHPKKCPELLILALPEILKKVPNTKVIFAGPGDRRKLVMLAEKLKVLDNIIFTGFVSERLKWLLIKRCDVFVLPSRTEAFGISLIEAMVCGKPVIATKKGPFPEIIRDGITGVLVPANSPRALAEAIVSLAANSDKRKELGERAAKDAIERFNIDIIAHMHLLLYTRLCGCDS